MIFSILIVLAIIAGFFFLFSLFIIGMGTIFEETKENIKERDILLSIMGIGGLVFASICLCVFCYISYEVLISAIQNLF